MEDFLKNSALFLIRRTLHYGHHVEHSDARAIELENFSGSDISCLFFCHDEGVLSKYYLGGMHARDVQGRWQLAANFSYSFGVDDMKIREIVLEGDRDVFSMAMIQAKLSV